MTRIHLTGRSFRAVTASAVLAVLTTACAHSASRPTPAPPTGAAADVPGQVSVQADGVALSITGAVAHLGPTGSGTLTMTVRNGSSVPEHLDMVGTPDGGRGTLIGAAKGASGMMTDAGILLQPGSTVTFGGSGPAVRLAGVHGVTASRTLPLALEFGVARLVHLSARVSPT
jgi:hypothetical protein